MADAAQIASAGTYLSKNAGVEVTDGTQVRVTLGIISSTTGDNGAVTPIDYGLKVVSSDGTTVIIDGTSDIFKISASGTTSVFVAAGTSAITNVTLPGLGSVSVTPAHLALVGTSNAASGNRGEGAYSTAGSAWVAATSGGATTTNVSAPVDDGVAWASVSVSTAQFTLRGFSVGGVTFYARYYMLTQAGL